MNHIKLVLVDIDGTLLNDNGIVTPKTIAAIQKLKEKHILFGIATGRTPYAVKHLIKDWKIDEYVDIIMGFNGGCYLDMRTQNMASCYVLDGKYIPMIFNEFKEFQFNAGIYDQESFHVLKEDDFAKNIACKNKLPLVVDGLKPYYHKQIEKMIFMAEKEEIQNRVNQIKHLIVETSSDFDKEKLLERLAKLAGGVAVVKVGAATEVEMKEKKLRIEDALNATRAAVEEGIVAGGGTALVSTIPVLDKLVETLEGEEQLGAKIVRKALEEPLRQIAINAGLEGAVIVQNVIEEDPEVGFDALNEKYVNMIEAGIVDPTKVTRSALQNAASIAGVFLTTEAAVADLPEAEPAMPGMGGGMPGMM